MSKQSLYVSSFPSLRPPLLLIVAGEKGGVGKSLVSLALANLFRLHDLSLDVLQIDAQQRLSRSLGRDLTTIRVDHKLARRDPAAAARAYTPLATAVEAIGTIGGSVLVDVGANEAAGLAQWLSLVDLAADLEDWNIATLIAVPYVAEAEAIRQASTTVKLLAERLPQSKILLVENQRDGVVGDVHPESDAAAVHAKLIAPLRKTASSIVMPLIEAGSWRPPVHRSGHGSLRSCQRVAVLRHPIEGLSGGCRPSTRTAQARQKGIRNRIPRPVAAVHHSAQTGVTIVPGSLGEHGNLPLAVVDRSITPSSALASSFG